MMTVTAWLVVAALAMAPPAPPGNDARPRLGAAGASDSTETEEVQPQDTVRLTDGTELVGTVTALSPEDYVTVVSNDGRQTLPWSELASIELQRADAPALVIAVGHSEAGETVTGSADAPRFDVLTRDGTPVALLRLRSNSGRSRDRFSTGYDEVCRAPCEQGIDAGSRRFFVDANPWTSSKVFEIPLDATDVQLQVRPGRPRLRKAGFGMMIAGGATALVGFTALAFRRGRNLTWLGINATALTLAGISIPVGAILYARGR